MTDPTLAAVQGVAQDVRDLRTDITGRLDQMVTRREHSAEVRRLDEVDKGLALALSEHERQADLRLTSIQASIDRAEQRRVDAQEAVAKRRTEDRRWFATWSVAAVGVAVAITQLIAALIR